MKANSLSRAMSTKKLLAIYGVLIVLGVAAVVYFGVKPRPVVKIKFSQFENSMVVANSISLSLMQELRETPILIVGIDPQEPFHKEIALQIWRNGGYDSLLVDSAIPHADLKAEAFNIKDDVDRFIGGIDGVLDKHLRLMVIVPQFESSQMIPSTVASAIKQRYKHPVFTSITFAILPRTREQEKSLPVPCNTGEEDRGGTAGLGCMLIMKSRHLYRKKLQSGQWVGFLDQIGTTDFVFLLNKEL
jgi:hypothetical protein